MIASFPAKALKRYWTRGDAGAIRADWRDRVRIVLSRLDVARSPGELDLPGLGLHRLRGDQAGRYAVWVSRNWRITLGWNGEDAVEVDLEDYHGS